jgi:uncharacterized protein YicC (UPF0701 family)
MDIHEEIERLRAEISSLQQLVKLDKAVHDR